MRRIQLALAVAALLTGAFAAHPASAQSVSVCTFESQVHITPGVTPTPSPATFTTPSPGTIECHGGLEGTGTITYSGTTGTLGGGESCAFDFGGQGILEYIIGSTDVTGTFTFGRAAVAGGFTGDTSAGPINGTFEFLPADGQDCATTPVTDATVMGQALIVY